MDSATILGCALLREECVTTGWWHELLAAIRIKPLKYYLYFTVVIEQDWGMNAEGESDLKIRGIYQDEWNVKWLVVDTDGIDYTVRTYEPIPDPQIINYRKHHLMKMGRLWNLII